MNAERVPEVKKTPVPKPTPKPTPITEKDRNVFRNIFPIPSVFLLVVLVVILIKLFSDNSRSGRIEELEAQLEQLQGSDVVVNQEAEQQAAELKRLRDQENEITFLRSTPGTQMEIKEGRVLTTRIRTSHGSVNDVQGGEAPNIEFRPSGPMRYLFPTYDDNPRRIELGYTVDDNSYPPPIEIPDDHIESHVWHQITDPQMAGIHSMAVVDTGNVWALIEKPTPLEGD